MSRHLSTVAGWHFGPMLSPRKGRTLRLSPRYQGFPQVQA